MIRPILLSLLLAGPVAAAPQCTDDRAAAVAMLAERYGEARIGMGLATGGVVELFASEAGTWTLTITTPDGRSCMMGAGEGWVVEAMPPKGDPT